MKSKYKTGMYLLLVLNGGVLLLFREEMQGQTQLIVTIIAVCLLMFGLYKMTSSLTSNQQRAYKDQEYFNREKYSQQEAAEASEKE